MKNYTAWVIPYGKGTQQVSATVVANNIKEAKEKFKKNGTVLKSEITKL